MAAAGGGGGGGGDKRGESKTNISKKEKRRKERTNERTKQGQQTLSPPTIGFNSRKSMRDTADKVRQTQTESGLAQPSHTDDLIFIFHSFMS